MRSVTLDGVTENSLVIDMNTAAGRTGTVQTADLQGQHEIVVFGIQSLVASDFAPTLVTPIPPLDG